MDAKNFPHHSSSLFERGGCLPVCSDDDAFRYRCTDLSRLPADHCSGGKKKKFKLGTSNRILLISIVAAFVRKTPGIYYELK